MSTEPCLNCINSGQQLVERKCLHCNQHTGFRNYERNPTIVEIDCQTYKVGSRDRVYVMREGTWRLSNNYTPEHIRHAALGPEDT